MRKAAKATQASLLRKSILQAAVEGKLVSQDSHDEPASVLLERIKAGKAQMVKDGKLKKEKPLPVIADDEKPFVLPEGWEWVRLGEICSKIGSGSTPRGGKDVYSSSGIPFLRSQNIRNDGLLLDNVAYISEAIHAKMQNTKVLPYDILLNITGASLGRCSLISENFTEANVSQHVTIIRSCDKGVCAFIHLLLLSPYYQEIIWERQVGMAREGLSKGVLELFEIPLPPLAEQKRIVAKVDELMHHCDQLEKAEQAATALDAHFFEALPKSILQAAVQGKLVPQDENDEPASILLERIKKEKTQLIKDGKLKKEKPLPAIEDDEKPFALPKGWEWCRLGEIVSINPKNKLEDEEKVAFLPMTLISQNYFGGHQQEERKWGQVKKGFTHFAEGDVLLAKITPCFENGKSCIAKNLKSGFGAGTTELHVLRCIELFTPYLLMFLKNPMFLQDAAENMTGTAGQQRVPTEYLRNYVFALPPMEEQGRIVAKIEKTIQTIGK